MQCEQHALVMELLTEIRSGCTGLLHAIDGYNGTPGLRTTVALLSHQVETMNKAQDKSDALKQRVLAGLAVALTVSAIGFLVRALIAI